MSRKFVLNSYKKFIVDLYNFKCQNKPNNRYYLGKKVIFEEYYYDKNTLTLPNNLLYNEHCPFNSNPCKKNRIDCGCSMNK